MLFQFKIQDRVAIAIPTIFTVATVFTNIVVVWIIFFLAMIVERVMQYRLQVKTDRGQVGIRRRIFAGCWKHLQFIGAIAIVYVVEFLLGSEHFYMTGALCGFGGGRIIHATIECAVFLSDHPVAVYLRKYFYLNNL